MPLSVLSFSPKRMIYDQLYPNWISLPPRSLQFKTPFNFSPPNSINRLFINIFLNVPRFTYVFLLLSIADLHYQTYSIFDQPASSGIHNSSLQASFKQWVPSFSRWTRSFFNQYFRLPGASSGIRTIPWFWAGNEWSIGCSSIDSSTYPSVSLRDPLTTSSSPLPVPFSVRRDDKHSVICCDVILCNWIKCSYLKYIQRFLSSNMPFILRFLSDLLPEQHTDFIVYI